MYVVYSIMLGGVFLIYLGIACRMGKYRSWYFVSDSRRSAIPYLGVPLGIGTILVGLSSLLPTEFRVPLLFLGWGGGFIVGLVFLFFQPSFLKPEWLKWLENEHKEIIMPFIKPRAIAF